MVAWQSAVHHCWTPKRQNAKIPRMLQVLFDWTALDRIVEIIDEPTISASYFLYRKTTSRTLVFAYVMAFLEIVIVTSLYVAALSGFATPELLIHVFIGMILFELVHSYVVNRYLFFRDEIFLYQVVPQLHEAIGRRNLSSELIKSFSLVTPQIGLYHLGVMRILRDVGDVITFIIIWGLVFLRGESHVLVGVLLMYFIALCSDDR
jgi:hypothetical protein